MRASLTLFLPLLLLGACDHLHHGDARTDSAQRLEDYASRLVDPAKKPAVISYGLGLASALEPHDKAGLRNIAVSMARREHCVGTTFGWRAGQHFEGIRKAIVETPEQMAAYQRYLAVASEVPAYEGPPCEF